MAEMAAARTDRPTDGAIARAPRTRLQERLQSELQVHAEVAMERRSKGDPTTTPEIDKYLLMIDGAMEGVYQRLGGLAAALQPILPEGSVHRLIENPTRAMATGVVDDPETELGARLLTHLQALSELEDVLGSLNNGVRL